MPAGKLKLSIVDVYGDKIGESAEIILRNQTLKAAVSHAHSQPLKSLTIGNLEEKPNGRYQIEVAAPSYLSVSQFIDIPSNLVLTLPVNKDRVLSVNFPPYGSLSDDAKRVLQASNLQNKTGPALYESLDDIRKAGFLNLIAKAYRTVLTNGQSVLAGLKGITELYGDRLFGVVDQSLHTQAKASKEVHQVSDDLHTPQPGFEAVDSYKTFESAGNLQLTFSRRGSEWQVDMDIDDAQGFDHIFQVTGNALTGQPTHPYNIHEILVAKQELDPGYTFNLAPQKSTAGAHS